MSSYLLSIVTVIYVGVTISEIYSGRPGMAVVFGGYALANIGFMWNWNWQ